MKSSAHENLGVVRANWWQVGLLISLMVSAASCQNRPTCKQGFYSGSILEGSPIGTTVIDLSEECSDADNDRLRFYLKNGNWDNAFRIERFTGALYNQIELDAEAELGSKFTKNFFTIYGFVRDNENPQNYFYMTFNIDIISVNDNVPQIINLPPSITIAENTPIGQVLQDCTLDDGDVKYYDHGIPQVKLDETSNSDGKFAVDSTSCVLMLVSKLDYETTQQFTLTYIAYDLDPVSPLTSTQDMIIYVTDVNDSPPTCTSYNILTSMSEETQVDSVVATVTCSDVDTGLGGTLVYTIASGDTTHLEIKDSSIGEVSLKTAVDFEAGDRGYEVEVLVTDSSSPFYSVTTTVVVLVDDADDNVPEFSQNLYTASRWESDAIGSVVLQVTASDVDSINTNLSLITYGFVKPCNPDTPWFVLDASTGAILIENNLDYELSPTWTCQVYAFSSNKSIDKNFANVEITLLDVNDRPPVFTQYVFEGQVDENTPAGTTVLRVTAVDDDAGSNGQFEYSLFSHGGHFSVDPSTGDLITTGVIDFEEHQSFLIGVQGIDKGSPSLGSHSYISIKVNPENEFTPTLDPVSDMNLSELTAPGTHVITFGAHDDDDGNDGALTFTLVDSSVPFLLETSTGRLLVGLGLDHEISTSHTLTVRVTDGSLVSQKSAEVTFTINVLDEDDHSPTCDIYGVITVTPSTDTSQPILTLSCTDVDATDSTVTYIKASSDPDNYFTVNAANGEIHIDNNPPAGVYILIVDALDGGGNADLTTTLPITIQVENALTFTDLPKEIDLNEHANVGWLVDTVSASGTYGSVTYSIVSGNTGSTFFLDSALGELKLFKSLDFDAVSQYVLTIRAESENGFTLDSTITINVIENVPPNAPPDLPESYVHLKIPESSTYPSLLQTIAAAPDPSAGAITYSIASGNVEGKFEYDSSGNLRLIGSLSFERRQAYTLELTAANSKVPPTTSTCLVLVEVEDVDEGPPTILTYGGAWTEYVSEDAGIGEYLFVIGAREDDTSDLPLTFRFLSGNEDNSFALSPSLGIVYLANRLDRETTPSYSLEVEVENGKGLTDTATLTVEVMDVNDQAPVFDRYIYEWEVVTGTPAGHALGSLVVSDPDLDPTGPPILSITSESTPGHFSLHGRELRTAITIDIATASSHTLEVTAEDSASPYYSSIATVRITVIPTFQPPKFAITTKTVTLPETTVPGFLVDDLDATTDGASEGLSGDLEYSIVSGNIDNTFYIEKSTGKVYLTEALYASAVSPYTLAIEAVNKHSPDLKDSFTLIVEVERVNRFAPEFSSTFYSFSLVATANALVGTVHATDPDFGNFGLVTYSMEDNPFFEINTNTGDIRTSTDLDPTADDVYYLKVYAYDDGGVDAKTSTSVVFISLSSLGPSTIRFTNSEYRISVLESTAVSTPFYRMKAEYSNPRVMGSFTYSITAGNDDGVFEIDSISGALSLKSQLDADTKNQYIFDVEATDIQTPPATASATVTVNVVDSNSNIPQFEHLREDVALTLPSESGTLVHTLTATDYDAGSSAAVSYFISDGNSPDNLFSIGMISGEIRTAKNITSATQDLYLLKIIAVDRGTPSKTGTTEVGVYIQPLTSTPPTPDHAFSILENQPPGTTVGVIPADPALTITDYIIRSGNLDFSLSISLQTDQTGLLTTTRELDCEQFQFLLLEVDVVHSTGVSTKKVDVTVLDENEFAPVVTPEEFQVTIMENTPVGTSVAQVTLQDGDATGGDFIVSVPSPLYRLYFNVTDDGTLILARPLDLELLGRTFSFRIKVSDVAKPRFTSNAYAEVTLENVVETPVYKAMPPGIYVTAPIPYDLETGSVALTLTTDHFGVTPLTFDNVSFEDSDETESVFDVQSSGEMLVNENRLRFYAGARYYHWATCHVNSGGVVTSKVGVVRFDTFSRNDHMVVILSSLDLATLNSRKTALASRLQSYFASPQKVRIYSTAATGSSARRRLLNSQSTAMVVVQNDGSIDDISNIDSTSGFVSQNEVLSALQASPDGTPVAGLSDSTIPIDSVMPYVSHVDDDDDMAPGIIAAIVIGSLVGLILTVVIIGFLVYCHIHEPRRKVHAKEKDEDSDSTVSVVSLDESESESPFRKFQRLHGIRRISSSSIDLHLPALPPLRDIDEYRLDEYPETRPSLIDVEVETIPPAAATATLENSETNGPHVENVPPVVPIKAFVKQKKMDVTQLPSLPSTPSSSGVSSFGSEVNTTNEASTGASAATSSANSTGSQRKGVYIQTIKERGKKVNGATKSKNTVSPKTNSSGGTPDMSSGSRLAMYIKSEYKEQHKPVNRTNSATNRADYISTASTSPEVSLRKQSSVSKHARYLRSMPGFAKWLHRDDTSNTQSSASSSQKRRTLFLPPQAKFSMEFKESTSSSFNKDSEHLISKDSTSDLSVSVPGSTPETTTV